MNTSLLNSPPQSAPRAFTLIELLTVIAIIGILAAIIIPTVGRVRESAKTAACKSNLRQIGLAVTLYTNENRYFPPASDTNSISFSSALRPYMSAGKSVNNNQHNSGAFVCPSREIAPAVGDENSSTYSAHKLLVPDLNTGTPKRYRPSEVPRPTEVILVADSTQQSNGRAYSNLWSVPEMYVVGQPANADNPAAYDAALDTDPQDSKAYWRFRHGGTLNVVFVDGHVSAFRKGEMKARNIAIGY